MFVTAADCDIVVDLARRCDMEFCYKTILPLLKNNTVNIDFIIATLATFSDSDSESDRNLSLETVKDISCQLTTALIPVVE